MNVAHVTLKAQESLSMATLPLQLCINLIKQMTKYQCVIIKYG